MNLHYVISSILALNVCSVLGLNRLNEQEFVSFNCTEARKAFGHASSSFIQCSIEYSRPITFCEECVANYIKVLDSYHNMSQVSNNGTPCINNFINVDRLGIVQTLYDNIINLWNRAKCYECFVTENGTQTNKTSEETEHFSKLYEDFQTCLNRSEENSICVICMNNYTALQDFFLSISNENEKIGVCMDIVDLMNTTWTFWGDKCCRFRRHNEYTFIISTVSILIATVLFYIIAQVCAKNKLPTIVEQSRFFNTLET